MCPWTPDVTASAERPRTAGPVVGRASTSPHLLPPPPTSAGAPPEAGGDGGGGGGDGLHLPTTSSHLCWWGW